MENRENILKGAIFWLLLATFFKGVIWSGIVPLWHFPDEQAHFAQLQNLAEGVKLNKEGSTSEEIYFSEKILGTERDERGNNRFTFHPQYNLAYSKGFLGFEELKIKNFSLEARKKMAISEATGYSPLYYLGGAIFYRAVYPASLFVRVNIVRLYSVLLTVLTIWLVYKIGLLVFKKKLWALSLAVLVSFQPMFTSTMSGVNSDVLFNFFFTLFIWASLLVLKKQNLRTVGLLLLSLLVGLLTKPQMFIALCLSIIPLGLVFWKGRLRYQKKLSFKRLYLLIGIFALLSLSFFFGRTFQIAGFILAGKESIKIGLFEHLIWTLRHTIAEVIPWYWGVFKWLGVVLPRWVNQVQMRLLGLTVLGLVIYLIKIIRQRRLKARDWQIGFLGLTALAYFLAVTLWNWQFRIAYGFPFGVQGRYFFPAIVSHMAIILVGLTSLVPKKFVKWIAMTLSAWWITLSFIGLWVVVNAYYQIWPLQAFWWQISQYKPFWFKAEWWFLWLMLFFISLLSLLVTLFKEFRRYEAKET